MIVRPDRVFVRGTTVYLDSGTNADLVQILFKDLISELATTPVEEMVWPTKKSATPQQ